ncbi:MAG: DUF1810 domain-containing protein [Alphaproteobacteria bacterium]|nr:DUF1810 domain-containing protein [Alphaproteobacteria bacterium]
MSLERFISAQAPIYAQALAELRAGQKQSHWMWFVFPQLIGLGDSAMARQYGIHSLDEASRYLAHPVLGTRYRECCQALMNVRGKSARDIFGAPDDRKFQSSLTLFAEVAPDEILFFNLLEKYFDGEADEATLERL